MKRETQMERQRQRQRRWRAREWLFVGPPDGGVHRDELVSPPQDKSELWPTRRCCKSPYIPLAGYELQNGIDLTMN